uniref:hypothetical protein n=1 Tax=Romboutsia sp. Marseille-P6047 TaxID=2161817 RepID=UPI0013DE6224
MKVVYLAFTPYHIKLCNYISKHKFLNDKNTIILSSFTGIEEDKLKEHIDIKNYTSTEYFKLNCNYKELLKSFKQTLKKNRNELY